MTMKKKQHAWFSDFIEAVLAECSLTTFSTCFLIFRCKNNFNFIENISTRMCVGMKYYHVRNKMIQTKINRNPSQHEILSHKCQSENVSRVVMLLHSYKYNVARDWHFQRPSISSIIGWLSIASIFYSLFNLFPPGLHSSQQTSHAIF